MTAQQLGRYEILEEIGKRGARTVYRRRDRKTGKGVAIKHLLAGDYGFGGDVNSIFFGFPQFTQFTQFTRTLATMLE